MKSEQLSFLELKEKHIKEHKIIERHQVYDATICGRCLCSKCKYNAESRYFSENEMKAAWTQYELCFNCDDCFYYGMDDDSLSKNIVRFECERFEMLDYYAELEAKRKRKSFKII